MRKYTTKELNEILLTKKIEDFYFVITQEINNEFPTEEKANEMLSGAQMSEDTSKNLSETADQISALFPGLSGNDINTLLFAFCEVNHMAVITKIDEETIYDVCTFRYIDLNKEKVVRFNNLSEYYTNENARPLLFDASELDGLVSEPSVTIDYDDVSNWQEYKKHAYESYENIDITDEFIKTIGLTSVATRKRR